MTSTIDDEALLDSGSLNASDLDALSRGGIAGTVPESPAAVSRSVPIPYNGLPSPPRRSTSRRRREVEKPEGPREATSSRSTPASPESSYPRFPYLSQTRFGPSSPPLGTPRSLPTPVPPSTAASDKHGSPSSPELVLSPSQVASLNKLDRVLGRGASSIVVSSQSLPVPRGREMEVDEQSVASTMEADAASQAKALQATQRDEEEILSTADDHELDLTTVEESGRLGVTISSTQYLPSDVPSSPEYSTGVHATLLEPVPTADLLEAIPLGSPTSSSFIDMSAVQGRGWQSRAEFESSQVDSSDDDAAMPVFVVPDYMRHEGEEDSDDGLPSRRLYPARRRQALQSKTNAATRATANTASGLKPPIPTTPKPYFKRSRSAHASPRELEPDARTSPSSSTSNPVTGAQRTSARFLPSSLRRSRSIDAKKRVPSNNSSGSGDLSMPPTTNDLRPADRAELVRKTRKLTRVFGTSPSVLTAISPSPQQLPQLYKPSGASSKGGGRLRAHLRGALSMSDEPSGMRHLPLEAALVDRPPTYLHARRHSSTSDLHQTLSGVSFARDNLRTSGVDRLASLPSFIDIASDDDAVSILTTTTHHTAKRRARAEAKLRIPRTPSTPSLTESAIYRPDSDEHRRRQREKLAKLHRYLGSRVPTDLVIGSDSAMMPPLQSPASPSSDRPGSADSDDAAIQNFLRESRSSHSDQSSGALAQDSPSPPRLKNEWSNQDRVANVRKAQKIQKMFGSAPPQDLYLTKLSTLSEVGNTSTSQQAASTNVGDPPAPLRMSYPFQSPRSPRSPRSPMSRNPNQSAYTKVKRSKRPSTAESSRHLMSSPIEQPESTSLSSSPSSSQRGLSDLYLNYRYSLNSLNDIVIRDDKESLVQLHDLINADDDGDDDEYDAPTPDQDVGRPVNLGRRLSLPSAPSTVSLLSEAPTVVSVTPEMAAFQARRRRAAKLTQFFGVNHRDLLGDVLSSIEDGVKDEEISGHLRPEEAQDLLSSLGRLRHRESETQ